MKKKDFWVIIITLFIVVITLVKVNSYIYNDTKDHIIRDARTIFNMDMAIRRWATSHGGVYVPVDNKTRPNKYLAHIKDREIISPSGKTYTLMNPAYILRQLNEDFKHEFGVAGHITSLLPLRPENKPDEWETKALKEFDKGIKEYYEFQGNDKNKALRLMRPLITENGCIKCHGFQGYKPGQIRGGISITLPALHEFTDARKNFLLFSVSLIMIWLMFLSTYLFSQIKIRKFVTDLQSSEEKYRFLFNNMMSGFSLQEIVYDNNGKPLDLKVLEVNDYAKEHIGLNQNELKGKTVKELFPSANNFDSGFLEQISIEGFSSKYEIYFDFLEKYLEVYLYSYGKGQIASVFMDITERKKSENELKISLHEKVILLKEIHHRVKNNMQIMVSLLQLQKSGSVNKEVIHLLDDSCNRILSMALVHEQLYQSKSFAEIKLDDYIKSLVSKLFIHFRDISEKISFNSDVGDFTFDVNIMIHLGLILNELITNSIKYAFKDVSKPVITLKIYEEGDHFIMLYSDNGVGIPDSIDFENVKTLGMTLIKNLSEQIDGEAEIIRCAGASFRISFNGKYT